MNLSPALLVCSALLLAGCSKKETPVAQRTNETASGNPITAPVDYLGAVAKAKHASEKVIDTTSIRGAIQKFYAMEDRYPTDLNELVAQHYLQAVPTPPPGTRWAYNAKTGELLAVRQP